MVIRFNNTLVEYFDISTLIDPKTGKPIPKDKFNNYKHPMFMTKSGVFKYFASVLIRNCANKIFLIDYKSSKSSDSQIYNDFPEGLKDHIKIINKNRSNINQIIKYLEPVSLDLNDINDKPKLYQIAYFFDKITLGSKYKAEVEINNYEKIGNIFNELNKKISDDEALFRLNAFNGIYNLYSNIGDIDTISLKATQYKGSIEKRVLPVN